jgi:hypothetical protein
MTRSNVKKRGCCSLLVALALSALLAGCGSTTSSSRYPSSSPEYELAVVDHNAPTVTDDQVAPYATALDSLQADCTNPRRQLADYATTIHEHFPNGSALHVLTVALYVARQAIKHGADRSDCKEAFAAAGVAVAKGT